MVLLHPLVERGEEDRVLGRDEGVAQVVDRPVTDRRTASSRRTTGAADRAGHARVHPVAALDPESAGRETRRRTPRRRAAGRPRHPRRGGSGSPTAVHRPRSSIAASGRQQPHRAVDVPGFQGLEPAVRHVERGAALGGVRSHGRGRRLAEVTGRRQRDADLTASSMSASSASSSAIVAASEVTTGGRVAHRVVGEAESQGAGDLEVTSLVVARRCAPPRRRGASAWR